MDEIKNENKDKTESGDIMAPAAVEKEREQYYLNMKDYLAMLKELNESQAKRKAKANLVKAGIIDKDGNLTDRYSNSRDTNKDE